MFSRRLLRIKVLQTLYAYHNIEGKTYVSTEKELLHSLGKSYELYHLLLLLIIDVVDFAESSALQAREKHIQTEKDLNPNTRFIDNQLIGQLRRNPQLKSYLDNHPVSWVNYPEIIRKLHSYIIDTDFFSSYMESDKTTYQADKLIVERIYFAIVMNYEDLYLNLEEQSIFWRSRRRITRDYY